MQHRKPRYCTGQDSHAHLVEFQDDQHQRVVSRIGGKNTCKGRPLPAAYGSRAGGRQLLRTDDGDSLSTGYWLHQPHSCKASALSLIPLSLYCLLSNMHYSYPSTFFHWIKADPCCTLMYRVCYSSLGDPAVRRNHCTIGTNLEAISGFESHVATRLLWTIPITSFSSFSPLFHFTTRVVS